MVSFFQPCDQTSASFNLSFCSFLITQSPENWRELEPCSRLGFGLRECCSWFDPLSRSLRLSSIQHSLLIIHVSTEVSLFIFFKNFSTVFPTSLTVRQMVKNWPEMQEFSSVQLFSCVRLFVTPWIATCQASLSITNSQSLPKLMSIESVMPSNHLILCRPLLLLSSIFRSIRAFWNESALCITWPKYWSFNFNISPSNEHPGLISFRMDWLDLLAVQGTLKSLLQHHSSKASILQCSAFFISPTLTSILDY